MYVDACYHYASFFEPSTFNTIITPSQFSHLAKAFASFLSRPGEHWGRGGGSDVKKKKERDRKLAPK